MLLAHDAREAERAAPARAVSTAIAGAGDGARAERAARRLRRPRRPGARRRAAAPRRATRKKCATSTGCARRRCVYDGISASPALLGLIGAARRPARRPRCCSSRNPAAQIQPQIERHLLVARAAGVQPPAGVADALDQLALDEAVHVLVGTGDPRRVARAPPRGSPSAPPTIARASSARQHAGGAERLGPGEAAGDVVLEERAIEAERDAEVEGGRIGGRVEAAGPERRHEHTITDSGLARRQCQRQSPFRPGRRAGARRRPGPGAPGRG